MLLNQMNRFYENKKFYIHKDIYNAVLHCIVTSKWDSQIRKEHTIVKSKRPGKSWATFVLPHKFGPKDIVYTLWYQTDSYKKEITLDDYIEVSCDGMCWA